MERFNNNLLQAGKQIQSILGNELTRQKIYANQSDINVLKRAMAVMQHHDAVTGTEKQAVADDYAQRIRYF
jgi:lysosomal alpha-mannosidase